MLKDNRGQAVTEMALSLTLFALSFFALDFLLALVTAKNRAAIYQHHLLFRAYRESERSFQAYAPHPDPVRLQISEENAGFSGREWFGKKPATNRLWSRYKPHFEAPARFFGGLEASPFIEEAKILRDPWDEHPIRYVAWGIAIAKTLVQGSGDESNQEQSSDAQNQDLGQAPGGVLLQNQLKEISGLTNSVSSAQELDFEEFLSGGSQEREP